MDTILLVLTITGIVGLVILSLVLLYTISLIRRTNIVMKKVDYLVEDITYKSESLSVSVEALNKIANYVLTFDTLSKKGYKSLLKLLSENRNYFYEIADKLKESVLKAKKKERQAKNTKTKKTKSSTKNKK